MKLGRGRWRRDEHGNGDYAEGTFRRPNVPTPPSLRFPRPAAFPSARGHPRNSDRHRILEEGDVNILRHRDLHHKHHSGRCRTWPVGQCTGGRGFSRSVERLLEGDENAVPGNHLNDICGAISDYANSLGFGEPGLSGYRSGDSLDPVVHMKRKDAAPGGMTLAVSP